MTLIKEAMQPASQKKRNFATFKKEKLDSVLHIPLEHFDICENVLSLLNDNSKPVYEGISPFILLMKSFKDVLFMIACAY